ncbi:MAG TPA: parallel beta-helix domain-containing protein [Leptospiraceae bacterium]|nr:parallel beta-helix domain-containing protein [Leptospiraceae bacterium]HNF26248.1 parallel beta-helix domain-containing protein [Leptospiraceae bacterium]HNI95084.1 parallel beta-helix domain-containing protein [Leptospiraceae bacterium]HNN05610.1 parallel beta-helix domain-containing protein [Leptospiraceae bacterium]HNO24053.1 parallel beta-helix domain-containing protein [Leptospiraceae bacterium]
MKTLPVLILMIFLSFCKKEVSIQADSEFQKKTTEALLKAKPNSVISLPSGKFVLDSSLSLTVSGVTLRGAGMDKTVLSFKGQKNGAEGILVRGVKGFTIEDLTIQDTKGDAVKVTESSDVIFRRVKTEWTDGPKETNGAYGIYPVQCKNVLIEDSTAIGASDSGIYVGQSSNIIVRRNRAEFNVAGIEIENSVYADVYENTATKNTGGILVFDLPGLPVQGGKNTRVFKNKVYDNDTENFAPAGNIVAKVPTGTGIMVMANDNIEIFDNDISKHPTVNMTIVSYYITDIPIKDPKYDPYPEGIHIHHNRFSEGGYSPKGLIVKALSFKIGTPFPDILYDGIKDSKKMKDGKLPETSRLCIHDNGNVSFADIDAENTFRNINRNLKDFECSLNALEEVKLSFLK